MKIKAIRGNIIFKFEDEINTTTSKNMFREKTESGFILPSSTDSSSKSPRWGVVISVGPECKTIKEGMRILIQPLAWTHAVPITDEEKVWSTDESKVLLYEE